MEQNLLWKELLGALIALAKTTNNNSKTEDTDRILLEGLIALKIKEFTEEMRKKKLKMARQEKYKISPNCSVCASPCGNTSEYDIELWKNQNETCQKLKEHILIESLNIAHILYQRMMLKEDISGDIDILYKVLEILSYEFEEEELEELREEVERSSFVYSQ